jgi:hypothetical protein
VSNIDSILASNYNWKQAYYGDTRVLDCYIAYLQGWRNIHWKNGDYVGTRPYRDIEEAYDEIPAYNVDLNDAESLLEGRTYTIFCKAHEYVIIYRQPKLVSTQTLRGITKAQVMTKYYLESYHAEKDANATQNKTAAAGE